MSLEDYQSYLQWLEEALDNHDCKLHAYVLMTNHVHLLLMPKKAGLVPWRMMSLGRRNVQYINRTYHRAGTLWDSRYQSSIVHADSYLLTCPRYIELNPVRAAMVDDSAHYRWSSYHHNAWGLPEARLTPHYVYDARAASDSVRQAAYRALFRAELDADAIDDIRLALNQNQALGSNRFHTKIEKKLGERRAARPRGRPSVATLGWGRMLQQSCRDRGDYCLENNRRCPL